MTKYIEITKQHKHGKQIEVWESSWDMSRFSSPAVALSQFYQFHEGYEPVGWIAENFTEQQFNEMFQAGQRLFWLEYGNYFMTVKIQELKIIQEHFQLQQELKIKSRLFEDLLVYCHNFLEGFSSQLEFKQILTAFFQFEQDNNVERLDQILLEIES